MVPTVLRGEERDCQKTERRNTSSQRSQVVKNSIDACSQQFRFYTFRLKISLPLSDEMDDDTKTGAKKKKRVLPDWMLEPDKICLKNPKKSKEDLPVTYVMSPYELGQYAKKLLEEHKHQK